MQAERLQTVDEREIEEQKNVPFWNEPRERRDGFVSFRCFLWLGGGGERTGTGIGEESERTETGIGEDVRGL